MRFAFQENLYCPRNTANCNALLHAKGGEGCVVVVFLGLILHLGKCHCLPD